MKKNLQKSKASFPVSKSWTMAYVLVIGFLILLIFLFKMFSNYYS